MIIRYPDRMNAVPRILDVANARATGTVTMFPKD